MAEMRRWRATDAHIAREMDISDEEVSRRKQFLEFRDEVVATLKGLNEIAQKYAEPGAQSA